MHGMLHLDDQNKKYLAFSVFQDSTNDLEQIENILLDATVIVKISVFCVNCHEQFQHMILPLFNRKLNTIYII